MDPMELELSMAPVFPVWRLGQITAEQPSTSYKEFKKEISKCRPKQLKLQYAAIVQTQLQTAIICGLAVLSHLHRQK
jgi:hypothetical protein